MQIWCLHFSIIICNNINGDEIGTMTWGAFLGIGVTIFIMGLSEECHALDRFLSGPNDGIDGEADRAQRAGYGLQSDVKNALLGLAAGPDAARIPYNQSHFILL